MRLIKQSSLYFKEGNSDKVYEIDLCDTGNDKYVVNFRYGRRGSVLKEGSKTPIPVGLQEAEKIFAALEDEKIGKGYTTSETGVSSLPKAPKFVLSAAPSGASGAAGGALAGGASGSIAGASAGAGAGIGGSMRGYEQMPAGRDKNIVKRLYEATGEMKPSSKKLWKLSRVIWKAGEFRIAEATPYIIQLFDKGDNLHQYCCTWSLARCGAAGVNALESIYKSHSSPIVTRIAGAGLLRLLEGDARDRHAIHYTRQLPEPMQEALKADRMDVLQDLLEERSGQMQPQYPWIESFYLLSTVDGRLRSLVKGLLNRLPLRPNHFKHVRAVFKMSELLDDHEVYGLLARRVEKEVEMFRHYIPSTEPNGETYVLALEDEIKPHKELLKKTSRVAYSQRTRWYLHHRVMRRLMRMRAGGSLEYVRLATEILLNYDERTDRSAPFSTKDYTYVGGYKEIETFFVANANAVFLHWLIDREVGGLLISSQHQWRKREQQTTVRGRQTVTTTASRSAGAGQAQPKGIIARLLQIFTGKKVASVTGSYTPKSNSSEGMLLAPRPGDLLYLHLWDQVPEAYITLLAEGKMGEVHQFAYTHLSAHPNFALLKLNMEIGSLKKLLLSSFELPANFGYKVVQEKYAGQVPPPEVLSAMLHSREAGAREKAKTWTEENRQSLLMDVDFVKDLLFAPDAEIRRWARNLLRDNLPASAVREAVIGKAVAAMMGFRPGPDGLGIVNPGRDGSGVVDGQQDGHGVVASTGRDGLRVVPGQSTPDVIINDASDILLELFVPGIKAPMNVISDLLQHPVPSVQLFGLRWLRTGDRDFDAGSLSKTFLFGLLQHPYQPVRETGISFLQSVPADKLIQYAEELMACCLSPFADVRKGLAPVMATAAAFDRSFGERAASALMPYLMRKESVEGIHDDTSRLLSQELSTYLQNANKDTALRLLYSHYAPAQKLGIAILEQYTDPSQLTIPQVVAMGNHENLDVRVYAWKFYREQAGRIHIEQEQAIRLLESKWQDTRQFAVGFFRDSFQEKDWSAEVLISLADSVKPDVEAFGRELITKYFSDNNGPQYLMQLSQHPSEKMQLFTSNYLERYAGHNDERILSLEYYFRSVLTRVNKNRIARNRVLQFLLQEGRRSETVAKFASSILTEISATSAIGDKAACIEVLLQLQSLYEVSSPLKVLTIETRV